MLDTTETKIRHVAMYKATNEAGQETTAILAIDNSGQNPNWAFYIWNGYFEVYYCIEPSPELLRRFIGDGDLAKYPRLVYPLVGVDVHTGKILEVETVTTKTITTREL